MTLEANVPLQEPGLSTLPPLPILMDGASAAVIQLDPQGRVQLWNHAAEQLFGWRADEVLGKLAPTVPNELWEDNQAWFLRCLGGQTMSGIQMKRRRKDGSFVNLHAWAWPVRSQQGAILGVMKMFFPVGERNVLKETSTDTLLRQQTAQAQRFHAAIVALTKTDYPSLESALHSLTSVAGHTLQVERVSVWLFTPDRQGIRCMSLYELSSNHTSTGMMLSAQDYPRYFAALEKSRTIAATSARVDPRTNEYTETYLKPLGITSMLDVPVRLHGEEIGIVCHEHVGAEREWTLEEQSFAGAIADLISLAIENHEHAKAENALRNSQTLLNSFVESSSARMAIAHCLPDGDLQFIWGNKSFLSGWPSLQSSGTWNKLSVSRIDDRLATLWKKHAQNALSMNSSCRFEYCEESSGRWLEFSLAPMPKLHQGHPSISCIAEDKTDYHRVESQLQQKQRLESLGLLAGTIAHDFNGLLTAIYGFIDLAKSELPADHASGAYLHSALQAALRANDLTNQLLAYAGKGKREIKRFDLSALVLEVIALLRGMVHEHGKLETDLSAALPLLSGDMTQIRQVVMNLITNAAESLQDSSGCVRVSTRSQPLSASELAACQITSSEASPGLYVSLTVSDQGLGMSVEMLQKIFDPFFSTKTNGRGLGLAAIVGIVRSHKAALHVESQPGKGTIFTVYFPTAGSP